MDTDVQQSVAKALAIEDLPEEHQKEIIEKMSEIVLERVTIEIFEKLPDDKKEELTRLIEEGDHQKTGTFMKEHVPNLNSLVDEVVADEVRRFREATS